MGKRGPKPKKGATLGARITLHTRKRLEAAAKASGLSISDEVENRLARSLDDDTEAWLLRFIGDTFRNTSAFTGQEWLTDPYTFDLMTETVALLLKAFRPKGDARLPLSVGPLRDIASAKSITDEAKEKSRSEFERVFLIDHIARKLAVAMIDHLRKAGGSDKAKDTIYRNAAVYLEGLLTDPDLLFGRAGVRNERMTVDGKDVWFVSHGGEGRPPILDKPTSEK